MSASMLEIESQLEDQLNYYQERQQTIQDELLAVTTKYNHHKQKPFESNFGGGEAFNEQGAEVPATHGINQDTTGGGVSGGSGSGGKGQPPNSGVGQKGNQGNNYGNLKSWLQKKLGQNKILGPSALGKIPSLGNIPGSAQPAQTSGNPLILIVVVGGIAIGAYFLYHKFRSTNASEKALDKGETPGSE